jgi:hypothetical protein
MTVKGFTGVAAKRLNALVRELGAEPARDNKVQYEAWRDLVISRATALFRMVSKKAVLDHLRPAQSQRLNELLGESVEAARQLASSTAS